VKLKLNHLKKSIPQSWNWPETNVYDEAIGLKVGHVPHFSLVVDGSHLGLDTAL